MGLASSTSAGTSSIGFQGDGLPGDGKPGSEEEVEVNIVTIGEVSCMFVDVEYGKCLKKCDRKEKTLKCLGGRPVQVLNTAQRCTEEIVTLERIFKEPYTKKYMIGNTNLKDWSLIGCEVDDDVFKVPEVHSSSSGVAAG